MTSTKRALTALATGALALPFIYAPAALAQTATPTLQPIAPFCENVPEGFDAFTDDDSLPQQFQDAINCIAFADVTTGVTEDLYVPARNVNRDAMASFIARLINRANELEADGQSLNDLPADDDVPTFTDIQGNFHEENIERLADAEVVEGGPGNLPATQYGPGGNVTRGQMASFIIRSLEFLTDENFAVTTDYFTDDEGSVHEGNINALAALGIVNGVAPGQYNPSGFVDRDNMALFLARTLGYLAEEGYIDAAPAPQDEATFAADATAAQGGAFTLTINGTDVETVTVTGDCIEDITFDDLDATAATQDREVPVNGDATAGDCVLTVTTTFTEASGLADEVDEITVEIVADAGNANESITVEPDTAEVITPVVDNPDTTADDNRSFTATGLDNDETYRITLVPCDNISRDANGDAVFAFNDADTESAANGGDELAAASGTQADIISINGAPVTASTVGDDSTTDAESFTATPVNGSLTFTVDGDEVECIVPVVYLDGGAGQTNEEGGTNARLELDENGEPVEPFGLGGETTFEPAESASGQRLNVDEPIVIVDEEADRFVTTDFSYEYDANDSFFVDTVEVTFAGFEAALSEGDELAGVNYRQDEELESVFRLTNLEPATPGITAVDASEDSVTLTVTNVQSGDTVTVYCDEDPFTDAEPSTGGTDPIGDGTDDADTNATTDSPVCATATADEDATTAGFQVVVDGLEAGTTYSFVATITRDGEESGASTETEGRTDAEGAGIAPVLQSADLVLDEVIEGLADDGDIYSLVFDENVFLFDADNDGTSNELGETAFFNATDADGDTILVQCFVDAAAVTAASPSTSDGITDAICETGDSEDDGNPLTNPVTMTNPNGDDTDGQLNDEVLVELVEAAEDRNAAGDGTTTAENIEYPLTITALENIIDADGNEAVLGTNDNVID